jgi:hypothetical protein
MAERQPIVNIFGISGPSGNPVQSPAVLYPRTDSRWNTFLNQYAVWPTTSGTRQKFTIYRIFDAPYTGDYFVNSSADNLGEVFINDLKVGGTTQTLEYHHWWWWGGWYGPYYNRNYYNGTYYPNGWTDGFGAVGPYYNGWYGGWYWPWYGYGGYYWGYWGHVTTNFATLPVPTKITLAQGINQIRMEVAQAGGPAGFAMNITDAESNVVWDTRSTAVVSEYTQTCGRYSLTSPINADIVAYLWGAGGGGGGNDAGSLGGLGAPGQFHKTQFSVKVGDQIEVVVGDGGTGGSSSAGSAAGGIGGASRLNLPGFPSFSGADGHPAGPGGSSGGGGGGGGASLIIVNGNVVAVAGGGAGGGGAGNDGNNATLYKIRNGATAYPDIAQIYAGVSALELQNVDNSNHPNYNITAGQRGQGVTGDGGGGGGGGGGWGGGAGGTVRGGDSSTFGGQSGGNYPFNQLFKHTAGNVSFVAPSGVTSITLVSATGGGGGGGSGNLTQGGAGGGQGAIATNRTISVVPGRLYEICIGAGGQGGVTQLTPYTAGTITDANLTLIPAVAGGFTSIRDTVTDTYLLKLQGGQAGNITHSGLGGTVTTLLGSGGSSSTGASGATPTSTNTTGTAGGGPGAGQTLGQNAVTQTNRGSSLGCGSAGAGAAKPNVFAANPDDQTRPQQLQSSIGGEGTAGAVLVRWRQDQRVGSDGELSPVSNASWSRFLNDYGMWFTDAGQGAGTVTRQFETVYSGEYKLRAAATGTLEVYIDDVLITTVTQNSTATPTPISLNFGKGVKQIKFNLYNSPLNKGFAVSISDSADKVYWDTRDNVGTDPPGSNLRYYASPFAKGGKQGSEGANGAVALEIYPTGLSTIKVNGNWRSISEAAVKVAGDWRYVDEIFVKINGQWRTTNSAGNLTTLRFQQEFGNYGKLQRTGLPPGPGGSGGGGCKIICQKLAELGYFDHAMNKADQAFGIMLRDQDPDAYNGYLRWAGPVVDLLEGGGSSTFRKIVFPWIRDEQKRKDLQTKIVAHYLDVIARPWAEEMAYRMNADGYTKSNPAGRFVMNIGLPLCRTISKFGRGKQLPMWAKTALIWGTTTVLLGAVTGISTVDKIVRKVGKLLGK